MIGNMTRKKAAKYYQGFIIILRLISVSAKESDSKLLIAQERYKQWIFLQKEEEYI